MLLSDLLFCCLVYTVPSLFNINNVFRQTDIECLREQEDQAAADNSSASKDQRGQKMPDIIQQHDQWSQGTPNPTDTRGVTYTTLPAQQHNQELWF